jgi:multicomponent Na+:H+ antiporter subunit C
MTPAVFYALVGTALFSIGLYGLFARTHLLRKILALNVMSSGVFLVLVSVAYGGPDGSPDPVPHAMVLTGIVVTVSATAFALALARRIYAVTGNPHLPPDELEEPPEPRQPTDGSA